MDFIESIFSHLQNFEDYANFAILFPDFRSAAPGDEKLITVVRQNNRNYLEILGKKFYRVGFINISKAGEGSIIDDKRSGWWKFYRSEGKTMQGRYFNNYKIGKWVETYPDGTERLIQNYDENGKFHGIWSSIDEEGNVNVDVYRHGIKMH
jgi:antitoxin component YwqK of YwqJK toxin-antitoxin module